MIFRSPEMGRFEFARLSALRAAQLMRGCTPKVVASPKRTSTALREVAEGKILALPRGEVPMDILEDHTSPGNDETP